MSEDILQAAGVWKTDAGHTSLSTALVLVWPTSWTPAIGGLIVCEYVCPNTCRHIARRMMNG